MMETKKTKRGGRREGAGHPVYEHKKKSLTLRVDEEVHAYLDEKGNKSRYVNELIKRDMGQTD